MQFLSKFQWCRETGLSFADRTWKTFESKTDFGWVSTNGIHLFNEFYTTVCAIFVNCVQCSITEPKSTRQGCAVKVYSIYVLFMLLLTYLINQLDRFLLGIVTKPMSQDLGYGDWACMRNESVKSDAVICNATNATE